MEPQAKKNNNNKKNKKDIYGNLHVEPMGLSIIYRRVHLWFFHGKANDVLNRDLSC